MLIIVLWGRGLWWRLEEVVFCCDVGFVVGYGSLLIFMGSYDGLVWRDFFFRFCLEVEGKFGYL